MVKVFEGTNEEYYIDGYLKANLDIAKNVIQKDWDMVFAIDGYEGSGKSVFAHQAAKYCDPTLSLDRIVFTPDDFRKVVTNAEPYQSVVYDEAYTGLSSRSTMGVINRALVSMLAEIRQKNLFVFVVMPTFFDLDKYVALWRSRGLFHIYTGENFQRGFFAFYNVDRKKQLYILGKKFYSYSKPKPNFIGRFVNHYTVDEKEYRKKKRVSLVAREKKAEEERKRKEMEAELFDRVMNMPDTIPHSVKIQMLSMPQSTYFVKLKKWREANQT